MSLCASFEVLSDKGTTPVGVLRIHAEKGSWEDRKLWIWGCTMRVRENRAELYGAETAPPFAVRLALKVLFRDMCIAEVQYEIKGRIITHKERTK